MDPGRANSSQSIFFLNSLLDEKIEVNLIGSYEKTALNMMPVEAQQC
jgi:hypothetical protein